MQYKKQIFHVENISTVRLSKKFDTPFYCYSYLKLKSNIVNFKNHFSSIKPLVCFSIKSNSNNKILREIKNLNCGADVVSKGELMKALKVGINSKKIVFSGVGNTYSELDNAINKIKLNELSLKELQKVEPSLNNNVLNIFDLKNSVNSKKSFGGTSFNNIKKMIVKYNKIYK